MATLKIYIALVLISAVVCLLDNGVGTQSFELDITRKVQMLETENTQQRNMLYTLTNQLSSLGTQMSTVMSKLQTLQSEYDDMKRKSQGSAFFAYLSKDLVNPPKGLTVVFDDVVTNVGSDYDASHGTYRATVNGSYHFTLVAASPPAQSTHGTHLFIMKNGINVSYLFLDASSAGQANWAHGTVAAVLHLAVDDVVWVQVNNVLGNHTIAGNYQSGQHSHFSGFLINTD